MADRPDSIPPPPAMELSDLTAASVLGSGANGIVFLVRCNTSGETLALKSVSKSSGDGGCRRIWTERDVLLALRHPLLPSLRGIITTEKFVGFAIDYCPGGDLNALRHCQTEKMFLPEIIRFYAAELVIALGYLHGMGVIYRDLKPENVLIQENGHVMLLDFDLSAKLPASGLSPETPSSQPDTLPANLNRSKNRSLFKHFCCHAGVSPDLPDYDAETDSLAPTLTKSNSFVGTEEYVAPEIIQGKGHDFAVDWWCLGIMLYEMLFGKTPFRGQNRKETFRRILTQSPELFGQPTPLKDLIGRMLEKDPSKRITGEDIRRHEFLRGVDWDSVVEVARPPFIPAGTEWKERAESLDVEKIVDEFMEVRNRPDFSAF